MAPQEKPKQFALPYPMAVIAHRGGAALAPENILAAYRDTMALGRSHNRTRAGLKLEIGVDGIQTDHPDRLLEPLKAMGKRPILQRDAGE